MAWLAVLSAKEMDPVWRSMAGFALKSSVELSCVWQGTERLAKFGVEL